MIKDVKGATVHCRPTILVPIAYYLPGFRAGGPLRTIANLVSMLPGYNWIILTQDKDALVPEVYPDDVPRLEMVRLGNAKVHYAPPRFYTPLSYLALLRAVSPDLVYIQSLFSRRFGVLPLLVFAILTRKKVLVAPRGELELRPLQLKNARLKRLYLGILRLLRIHNRVVWHASSTVEADSIRREFGASVRVLTALDPVHPPETVDLSFRCRSARTPLEVAFVSRITPIKNLKCAIEVLSGLDGVVLRVAGPIDDQEYWNECIADASNKGVSIDYLGEVGHDRVIEVFRSADVFLFTTLSENFGHVVHESLSAGCPVVTTTGTPWLLPAECGTVVDPADVCSMRRYILKVRDWSSCQRLESARACVQHAKSIAEGSDVREANERLFETLTHGCEGS